MAQPSSPPPDSPAAIALERVCFRYPDGVEALRDVSLNVRHGERVALVGPNGSGKSTLLRQLNGLLTPTSGRVTVMGVRVARENLTPVRRRVGYVFQDPDDQLFCPTVLEDVAFGPLHLGLPTREVLQCVRQALALVGLSGYEARVPQRLSAGEKALVALATVLSYSADVLVLDEPSAALDPRNRRRLLGVLDGLERTQLIATHDLDFAWEHCRRAVLLADGRVAADGPAGEILTDRALLERHGLELPLLLQGHQ
jgi:cobalt transport protein ATP-binding subunit